MSKGRLTKKQMQTDELREALEDARDFVSTHQAQTRNWAVAGICAAVAVGIVWGGFAYRSTRLSARLSNALALYDAPLVTDGVAPVPGAPVFKDAAERTAAVQKELKALAEDAPSSQAGRAARLLLMASEGGKPSGTSLDAARDLAKSAPGSVATGIAALSYLEGKAATGAVKEAIDVARGYLESSEPPLPKDVIIFTLGQLYERSGQLAEAKTYYQRLVSDFPESPMRSEAQQKAVSL